MHRCTHEVEFAGFTHPCTNVVGLAGSMHPCTNEVGLAGSTLPRTHVVRLDGATHMHYFLHKKPHIYFLLFINKNIVLIYCISCCFPPVQPFDDRNILQKFVLAFKRVNYHLF